MDKRKEWRVSLMTEIAYHSDGVVIAKRISDISEGGVFIDTSLPSDVGTEMQLRFQIDGQEVVARGRVVHCQPYIGMGVEFTSISRECLALIRGLVEQEALATV